MYFENYLLKVMDCFYKYVIGKIFGDFNDN